MSLIAIRFRHVPQQLFRETPLENMDPNWVVLSIQPAENMHLEIHAKQPGLGMRTHVIQMNAGYRGDGERAIDAYEALLLDIVRGDATNFIRFDEVEWAWRVVDPILKAWAQEREFISSYPTGSWGRRKPIACSMGLPEVAQRRVSAAAPPGRFPLVGPHRLDVKLHAAVGLGPDSRVVAGDGRAFSLAQRAPRGIHVLIPKSAITDRAAFLRQLLVVFGAAPLSVCPTTVSVVLP
jgi:hypothetical protein